MFVLQMEWNYFKSHIEASKSSEVMDYIKITNPKFLYIIDQFIFYYATR